MQAILSDHNCEGQAEIIFAALRHHGFIPFIPMQLLIFEDIGLHHSTDDRTLWQLCQERSYLLLTGNRTASDGYKSLEYVIHNLLQPNSLPVITIGNLDRINADPTYCWNCAEDLVEIVLNLDAMRGVPRLYIPYRALHQQR